MDPGPGVKIYQCAMPAAAVHNMGEPGWGWSSGLNRIPSRDKALVGLQPAFLGMNVFQNRLMITAIETRCPSACPPLTLRHVVRGGGGGVVGTQEGHTQCYAALIHFPTNDPSPWKKRTSPSSYPYIPPKPRVGLQEAPSLGAGAHPWSGQDLPTSHIWTSLFEEIHACGPDWISCTCKICLSLCGSCRRSVLSGELGGLGALSLTYTLPPIQTAPSYLRTTTNIYWPAHVLFIFA